MFHILIYFFGVCFHDLWTDCFFPRFAPDFTNDLLAELEPHFLRLQNDSQLLSSDRLVFGRPGDEISTTFTDSDCQLSSSTSTEKGEE